MTARQSYYPYGAVRTRTGSLPTERTFTGQVSDVDSTGLLFFNARYYDGALGRFISADSIVPQPGNPQSLNRYSFSLSNPLKYTDPSGHCPFCIVIVVGAVGGAIGGAVYGYGSQVVDNLRQGASIDQALTTNIDPGKVVFYTVAGAAIGSLVAPVVAPVAAKIAEGLTTATAACAATGCVEKACGGNCSDEIEAGTQSIQQALPGAQSAAQSAVQFSPHALERMTQRGVAMDQVQTIMNTAKPFQYFHNGVWKTGFYDPVSKIFVGQVDEVITTVITNVKPQYIENLQKATP